MNINGKHIELCKEIKYHDMLYYHKDEPEISDQNYDTLRSELEALEEAHPDLITPESPTQMVGYPVQSKFKTVKHAQPMLSLSKVHSKEDLIKWGDKIGKKFAELGYQGFKMLYCKTCNSEERFLVTNKWQECQKCGNLNT